MSNLSTIYHEEQAVFADLILPLPLPKPLTYRVPTSLVGLITTGSRVIVPLGHKKILTGLILKLHHQQPKYPTKSILDALDDTPIVNTIQLHFFQWMAQYYICTTGEVMLAALPNGLRLSSQSKIQLHPEFEATDFVLTEKELLLLGALKKQTALSYAEAEKIVDQKRIHQLLKTLIDKQAIILFEEVREKYVPKKVKQIRLHEDYTSDQQALERLFGELEKYPKQLDILLKYVSQAPIHPDTSPAHYLIEKKAFLAQENVSPSSFKTLVSKKIFVEEVAIVPRFNQATATHQVAPTLSPAQQEALRHIQHQFQDQATVLLHGVTASGKTEIYSHLIQEALQGGGQVLYLLPEIALTTQLVKRLRHIFGDQLGVYHSKYSDNERVEVWNAVLEGKYNLVIGTRSSIFLPFSALGLIIVDEEHETSYKQWDTMPRYHARDSALVLAQHHQAKVLLGSATPSIESYYHAKTGKYGLTTLGERFEGTLLPSITLVNMRIEQERKTLRKGFSPPLLDALTQALDQHQQAIIFQNRRGYAPYITCEHCTWVPTCTQCAVSLTYHQYSNRLSCHYCGCHAPLPHECEVCGSHALRHIGSGTEQVEEILQLFFPEKCIQRMDFDTTRGKHGYERLITSLEQGKTDILVGTQMIAKGLDFEQVSLVGVLDVDRLLNFPDFRANERCFQLLTQVSGRAGRRGDQGHVIIQTNNPKHAILEQIVAYDYEAMYQQELAERRQFLYPPYVRLVQVILKHKDRLLVQEAAKNLAEDLKQHLGKDILGPQAPLIARVKNNYLMDIWVKIKRKESVSTTATKATLKQCRDRLLGDRAFKSIQIIFDVDPA